MKFNLSFEARILSLICVLGLMRMGVGVYQIFTLQVGLIEQILNYSFILFFLFNLYFALAYRYSKLGVAVFCYVLLLMLSVTWLIRDGLSSNTDAVFMAIMIVFAAISRGKFLVVIVCTVLCVEILILLMWLHFPDLFETLKTNSLNEVLSYQLLLVLVALIVFFMSYEYQGDLDKLAMRNAEIRSKIRELEVENHQIEKNRKQLEQINQELAGKIATRVSHLIKTTGKIAKFIRLSSREISPSLIELKTQIDELSNNKADQGYLDWLKKSGNSLINAFEEVKSSYEERMREII
ncbi:hypothetical protein SAMN04488029_0553 [Reichenbachiella faecimaris]|uniref:Uncharacterized protein n=1 Tax=Reichenbachiella faecimaris TaxID=692418 RepID=A0A1W2G6I2_REIFA|nr:hypothetical protein [Reichenbachiella faecimaris]SMD32211.1 hypothetical protein SAMN04488029_0553 [Reichenbachiella faecimaris]